jgi:hypothetical protein
MPDGRAPVRPHDHTAWLLLEVVPYLWLPEIHDDLTIRDRTRWDSAVFLLFPR